MARCKHWHIHIQEPITCYSTHSRNTDDSWHHNNEEGGYGPKLEVICDDCGLQGVYWRHNRRNPRWLKDALEDLGIG